MIKRYFRRLILIHKGALLMEVLAIKGLMQLWGQRSVITKIETADEVWNDLISSPFRIFQPPL